MKWKILIFISLMFLLVFNVSSLEWVLSNEELKTKSIDVSSTKDRYYIGDFSETKEWGYKDAGFEVISSDKKLIQKGAYVCVEEDYKNFVYNDCIYYPTQYIDVLVKADESNKSGYDYYVKKNIRNITRLSDYSYRIDFGNDYDPTSTSMQTGLLAYYNASQTTDDVTGNYHMTAVGGMNYNSSGKIGYAFIGDSSDYMINGTIKHTLSGDSSYVGWFKTGESVTTNRLVIATYGNAVTDTDGFFCAIRRNNDVGKEEKFYCRYFENDGGGTELYSVDVVDNNWHFFAVIINATSNQFGYWLDGTFYGESDTITGDDYGNLTIMNREGVSAQFAGIMDEVGVWNRRLNKSEIDYLYNGTYGMSWPFDNTTGGGCSPSVVLNTNFSVYQYDDLEINLTYNVTLTCSTNNSFQCDLYHNRNNNGLVLNDTEYVSDLTVTQNWIYDLGFLDDTNFSLFLSCHNNENIGNSSVVTYDIDTVNFILYDRLNNIDNNTDEVLKVIEMIGYVLFYFGLMYFGYYLAQTGNYLSGMFMYGMSILFDFYWIGYLYDELYALIGTSISGRWYALSVVMLLLWVTARLFSIVTLKRPYRKIAKS